MLEVYLFILLILIVSLTIDLTYGELPTKIHPVVIIGMIINFFKKIFISINNKWSGFLTTLFTMLFSSLILIILLIIVSFNDFINTIVSSVILSSTYSIKMLISTANDIKQDLSEDVEKAKKSVSYLVSRNTDELTEEFIVSATIESMTENITDSFIAPIFYFAIISIVFIYFNLNNYYFILILVPFIYRISNTLDAMLGYKTDELINIGFFPAKLDDILNYIPSRISCLFIIISAFILRYDGKNAYKITKRDANNCPSPNSGYTMAPTAGALNIQLIKKDTYVLGDNTVEINVNHITKAIKLTSLTIGLFTIFTFILIIIVYMII